MVTVGINKDDNNNSNIGGNYIKKSNGWNTYKNADGVNGTSHEHDHIIIYKGWIWVIAGIEYTNTQDVVIPYKFFAPTNREIRPMSIVATKYNTFDIWLGLDDQIPLLPGTFSNFKLEDVVVVQFILHMNKLQNYDTKSEYNESLTDGDFLFVGDLNVGLVTMTDYDGTSFTDLISARAKLKSSYTGVIFDESFSVNTYRFSVPKNSTIIGVSFLSAQNIGFEDPKGLFTSFGAFSFKTNFAKIVLGNNVSLGSQAFGQARNPITIGYNIIFNGTQAFANSSNSGHSITIGSISQLSTDAGLFSGFRGKLTILDDLGNNPTLPYTNGFANLINLLLFVNIKHKTNNNGGVHAWLQQMILAGAKVFYDGEIDYLKNINELPQLQGNVDVLSDKIPIWDASTNTHVFVKPNKLASNNSDYINFIVAPTFTNFPLVMAQKQNTAPLTITPNSTGAIPGAMVIMRIIADGILANTPIFANAEQVTGSSGWDNRLGKINIVQMLFDGTSYYYSIVQPALGAILDLQAPSLIGAAFNTAGNVITLTYNEDLLTTSIPTPQDFIGTNVASVTILNKIVTINLAISHAPSTTINLNYKGLNIKDLAGNLAPIFTIPLTVAAAVATPILVNLASRNANIAEVSVGTYKATTGGDWKPAIATSFIFTGDKTFEITSATLGSGQGIIGLDATATSATTLGDWPNLDLGMAWYGGNYQAMRQGQGQVACGGHQQGDLVRFNRISGVLKAQFKRGAGAWTDLFTFPSTPITTGALAPVIYLNDQNSQITVSIY